MSKSRGVYKEMNFTQSGMFNTLNLSDQLLITDYSLLITHYSFPLSAYLCPLELSPGYSLLITHYSFHPSEPK